MKEFHLWSAFHYSKASFDRTVILFAPVGAAHALCPREQIATFRGKIDQIDRIKKLLEQKASTRALAILVDPFRDFTADGSNEEFASFSLVAFRP